jgi:ATP-dependent DNA helicase DinG
MEALPAGALIVGHRDATWLAGDGEIETLSHAEAARRAQAEAPVVCHAPTVMRRLQLQGLRLYDILTLYAFVRPARFCLPTPRGLALALGLPLPSDPAGEALALMRGAAQLLDELETREPESAVATAIAMTMAKAGWCWGPAVLAALGRVSGGLGRTPLKGHGFDVWARLPEFEEPPPEGSGGDKPVNPTEARWRLRSLLGPDAEARSAQGAYAEATAAAFQPRDRIGEPNLVLAEAGTGIGKTLGYIAPASLWAERNETSVWVSTFTKNLQRQLDQELDRLYPDPAEKARKVVIRKGRENYLCLLNFQEAVERLTGTTTEAIPLGLIARWARASRDGDMVGGDFPAWLMSLFGVSAAQAAGRFLGLTDRRGECVYSACVHYRRCFIERVQRKSRHASIVVANHALVMIRAALLGDDETELPTRYVFDEGHHLFDAADNAFSAELSGRETAELRRWLLGGEGGRGRARGLERRVGELVVGDEPAIRAMQGVLHTARVLPAEGWAARLRDGRPSGPTEAFLALVRQQVMARAEGANDDGDYDLECDPGDPVPGLLDAAERLEAALAELQRPMVALVNALKVRLDQDVEDLDTSTRLRIDAAARALTRRIEGMVKPWRAMLQGLKAGTPPEFVDWYGLSREWAGGRSRESDVGFHRHWIDPTIPFARIVLTPAHGAVVTSATLRDQGAEEDWPSAELRTGASHLPVPAKRVGLASPFDYPAVTRVLVVTDVRKSDLEQVAATYRGLFLAAGGGGLGLFTAIRRLRGVHRLIAGALEQAQIPLYAQHVDPIDAPTLVDIFRAEVESCLLGTDAMRDGVDVPGRSLRLIVFDRVPWQRPDLMHKARREAFGGRDYDDRLTRLKLKQAFGRLIRRNDDKGVFVLLDPALPSRLHGAFPPGVEVQRVGIKDAIEIVGSFVGPTA